MPPTAPGIVSHVTPAGRAAAPSPAPQRRIADYVLVTRGPGALWLAFISISSVSLGSLTVPQVLAFAGGKPGGAAASLARCCLARGGAGDLSGRPGNSCHAGQGGALEDLTDVVQGDDQFLEPVKRGVVLPVQQGAAVLLKGDGPAGQLDLIVLGAEQGLDGSVESESQGGELGGGEGTLAAFSLMDGLPAPGLAQIAAEGFAEVGQRQLPLRSQACDLSFR